MAVYRHLNKVGKHKQDDKNDEYVTPPTLAVDVPVFKESASSVTVSLSDIFVPGEEKDDPNDSILVGPPKRVQMTGSQQQVVLNKRKKKQNVYNRAFKRATIFYVKEKSKKGGKLARQVSEMAKREFSVDISARTIQDAVYKDHIGVSPLQRGPRGAIPDVHYKNLCIAFESFLSINQDNGDVHVRARKKLRKILHQVVYGEVAEGKTQAHHLLARVVRDSNTELKAGKVKIAED